MGNPLPPCALCGVAASVPRATCRVALALDPQRARVRPGSGTTALRAFWQGNAVWICA
jgi:hypothetical protein